ncbi:hypothetical protein V2A60_002916 [Cordyceps javanica]|uniref:Bicyclomycin resistance protein n=1 Tax=Cordyceps javanica TaxID=43265 RepID=A0A545V4R7_9HYPO|nr:bicyclomycin resistance protein [Cordyceps javanica]TQW07972.1 bicyclomycin resistance protein [Cordyceps javanica]
MPSQRSDVPEMRESLSWMDGDQPCMLPSPARRTKTSSPSPTDSVPGTSLPPHATTTAAATAEMASTHPSPPGHAPHDGETCDGTVPYDLSDVRRGVAAMNAAYDWTGPSDPDNPRNFPLAFRVCSAAALTLLAMVGTVVGAMYAPAQDAVAAAFGVPRETAVLPLSMYNLGLACGPLVGGPLSETYGRRAVVLGTAPVFMLFVLGGALVPETGSIAGLVACRFLAGMFAAPLINNAPATMLDFTPTRHRGVVLGIYYTVPSFGASLGPLAGGFLVHAGGWRWTQWAALVLAAACYLPVAAGTRETYKKIILRRRATRLGLRDSASQRTSPGRALRHFATTLVQRPLHMLLTEPIVALVSLYCGFLFALLYTYVVAVPWIFGRYYGFAEPLASLSFLGLIVGTLAASVPLVAIDVCYYQPRLRRWQAEHGGGDDDAALPSEHRLVGALAGSLLLPACLFASAWTAERRAHWIAPVVFQGCVMLASILIYSSASLFMLDAYGPLYGASASGAAMMSRYVLSAAFPLFALQMYEALGVGWATTVLGCVTLAMAPIPWCFWVFGERIRKRSRYETST